MKSRCGTCKRSEILRTRCSLQEVGHGVYEVVGEVNVGAYGGYGQLYPAHKLLMCVQMVLGRLEILAPLALLTPGFWRH